MTSQDDKGYNDVDLMQLLNEEVFKASFGVELRGMTFSKTPTGAWNVIFRAWQDEVACYAMTTAESVQAGVDELVRYLYEKGEKWAWRYDKYAN